MDLRHIIFQNSFKKSAMYWLIVTVLVLAIATSTLTSLTDRTANALPAGFFHIISIVQDSDTHAFVAMDAARSDKKITGFVHNNPVAITDSQLWKERLVQGTIGVIKLENKLTGQCIAMGEPDSAGSELLAVLRPCSDPTTLWQKFLPKDSAVMVVFERTSSDRDRCLSRRDRGLAVGMIACEDHSRFDDNMIWDAEPLGTVSQPSVHPSRSPPPKPTGCTLQGTANCGLVGFNCNPLSTDTIFVRSGEIRVGVTSVAPALGMINGTYLNEGNASVAVCARRAKMTSCSDPIDVTFGPRNCPGRTPHGSSHPQPTCPTGRIPCGAGCGLPSDPECRIM
jgi:hypothetical protein